MIFVFLMLFDSRRLSDRVLADGVSRMVLTVNRMMPGPSIQVAWGGYYDDALVWCIAEWLSILRWCTYLV